MVDLLQKRTSSHFKFSPKILRRLVVDGLQSRLFLHTHHPSQIERTFVEGLFMRDLNVELVDTLMFLGCSGQNKQNCISTSNLIGYGFRCSFRNKKEASKKTYQTNFQTNPKSSKIILLKETTQSIPRLIVFDEKSYELQKGCHLIAVAAQKLPPLSKRNLKIGQLDLSVWS